MKTLSRLISALFGLFVHLYTVHALSRAVADQDWDDFVRWAIINHVIDQLYKIDEIEKQLRKLNRRLKEEEADEDESHDA
jgi:hypothetical protein